MTWEKYLFAGATVLGAAYAFCIPFTPSWADVAYGIYLVAWFAWAKSRKKAAAEGKERA
ncbi:hypothetical protein JCM19000A_05560 [Silvimonas sp. JCM 19000]